MNDLHKLEDDNDRREYLVTLTKGALYQARVLLNALWSLTPEKDKQTKLRTIFNLLDSINRELDTLF